jgi:hypothetical protein
MDRHGLVAAGEGVLPGKGAAEPAAGFIGV